MKVIKFKYLWAWDRMMHSSLYWSECRQLEAYEDKAPLDCIYKDRDGKWHRFCDIENPYTKRRIANDVARMERNF